MSFSLHASICTCTHLNTQDERELTVMEKLEEAKREELMDSVSMTSTESKPKAILPKYVWNAAFFTFSQLPFL